MAIIYTYPVKGTPLAADLVLISDTADGNKSKNATIASLVTSNAIDVVDTLNSLKGDVSITGGTNITVTPSGQNIEISTSASNVDGSGTANTIPKWSDSNTLTDSPFTIDTSTNSLDIPSYIRHIGDIDSLFGFSNNDDFIINVNSGTDQIRVRQNSIIISTDSGTKLAAGPTGVTLYNDENGSTTVSKVSLVTYDSGIIVKGGTENSFARGGAVRFYNSTDSGFVGIKGPTTMSPGSNYEIILPGAVGGADQVLKLPSTIGSTPYQLAWGDAAVVTASQGLTKTANDITLDIADPTTGWAILGGGAGATTSVIGGSAGANATGTKNFGISEFINSSSVTSADQNVAVGLNSMGTTVTTASRNVVVGHEAGESMTTSSDSVLIGQDAGEAITTGGENTIIGSNAGETITTGTRNTIIGSGAIAGTGSASVFSVVVGREASATSSSTAVGSGAIVSGATGTAVGDQASVASTATNGIALGKGAQATLQGTVGNVAIGSSANPVSLDQPEEFSATFSYLNVTINGAQYYIRLYTADNKNIK